MRTNAGPLLLWLLPAVAIAIFIAPDLQLGSARLAEPDDVALELRSDAAASPLAPLGAGAGIVESRLAPGTGERWTGVARLVNVGDSAVRAQLVAWSESGRVAVAATPPGAPIGELAARHPRTPVELEPGEWLLVTVALEATDAGGLVRGGLRAVAT